MSMDQNIRARIPNILVVPDLFEYSTEQLMAWMRERSPDKKPPRKGTISDRILRHEAQARHEGHQLPYIVSGRLTDQITGGSDSLISKQVQNTNTVTELDLMLDRYNLDVEMRRAIRAKQCAIHFDSGRPLYIGYGDNNPQFPQHTIPVLRHLGYGRYMVGTRGKKNTFKEGNHFDAVHTGRRWFMDEWEEEVGAIVEDSKQKKYSPILTDTLGILLHTDDQITTKEGGLIAWKNGGIHDRWVVRSLLWCIITVRSYRIAGRLVTYAHDTSRQIGEIKASLDIDLGGRMVELCNLKRTEKNNWFLFDGGDVIQNPSNPAIWAVRAGKEEKKIALIKIGKKQIQIKLAKGGGKAQEELVRAGVFPESWNASIDDLVAWATWYVLRSGKTKSRFKGLLNEYKDIDYHTHDDGTSHSHAHVHAH